jgi:uncharacterized lipoprotein YbaY
MREALALVASVALALVACQHCTPPTPEPVTIVTVGDARVDGCEGACGSQALYCPASMPDGGYSSCVVVCHARAADHSSNAFAPASLTCASSATTKAAFLACGTMSRCD